MTAHVTEHHPAVTPTPSTVRQVAPVPFARLVRLELRKMVDTRAGRWLLGIAMLLLIGVSLIPMLNGTASDGKDWADFVDVGMVVLQLLLPIVGILAVTSEWSQRTGLVTFTLEPRRVRVALAKWAAAALLALGSVLVALVAGAVFTALTELVRGSHPSWAIGWQVVLGVLVGQLAYVSIGVAFGMLLQITAAAIVAYLLIPSLWSMVGNFSWMSDVADWADTNRTTAPLLNAQMHGEDWARLVVSLLIWLALPMALGIWRMTRREVKSS